MLHFMNSTQKFNFFNLRYALSRFLSTDIKFQENVNLEKKNSFLSGHSDFSILILV